MSVVAPSALEQLKPAAAPSRRRRGLPGLRGTGLLGHVCAGVLALAVVIALIGSVVAPYDPNQLNLSFAYVGPLGNHYLGFDGQGRDLVSRLLVGSRTSLLGPMLVATAAVAAGSVLAVAAAWIGGWFDTILSAILDVLFAFPGILLAVVAAAVFGPGLTSAASALAIAYAPYIARVLRGAALRERAQQYIAALEVQGFTAIRICLRHLLPNIASLIVAQGTILFGWAMVDLAAISFLGLGVQPPQADWGVMISDGKAGVIEGYPAEALAAALCIVVVVTAVSFLGERLNECAQGVRR
jgi:peptide/nickel transport system permease protein